MKRLYVYAATLALCCIAGGLGVSSAAENDKGPVEITLQAAIDAKKVPKPAFLTHQAHQKLLGCDGCHHGKDPDGKKTGYVDGQKIEKCETCHNSKAGMPEKVATLKRASHVLCMECHRQNDEELTKCGVCHTKK